MTQDIEMYLVGGAVRDMIRGVKSNDWDFAVVAESYDAMREWLVANDFEIFLETPKYFTIRARAPKEAFQFAGIDFAGSTFDFTLCRKERDYTDGRHPAEVEVGTLEDDLARRDFTMNAIALDVTGVLIDPYGGAQDIEDKIIRCVGGLERLSEDGLRIMRAIRFWAVLEFNFDPKIHSYLQTRDAVFDLDLVSDDRIRQELAKALKANTADTIIILSELPDISNLIFNTKGLWLEPTSKGNNSK